MEKTSTMQNQKHKNSNELFLVSSRLFSLFACQCAKRVPRKKVCATYFDPYEFADLPRSFPDAWALIIAQALRMAVSRSSSLRSSDGSSLVSTSLGMRDATTRR